MTARTLTRTLAASAAVAAAAFATTVAHGRPAAAPAPKKITAAGVDGVKLGAIHKDLRAAGRVGPLHHGCNLAGPNTAAATLRSPLRGSVDYTKTSPHKVTNITVRGGATARGVGVGATKAKVKAKFPQVKFDHRTDATFGLTLARVPRRDGGKLQFAIDTTTHKVTLIGIPFIAFCE
jgi:hypothetical protein